MSNGTSQDYTALVKKFRKQVADVLTEEQKQSDAFLLRWLLARDYDVGKAEVMLRNSVEWRKKNDIDNVLRWEAPEVLRLYYPVGFVGQTNGSPILVVPFGRCDIKGIIESGGKENFIRYTYQVLEQAMFKMKAKTIVEKEVTQMIVIFDCEGLSLRHLTYRATVDVLLRIVGEYEKNYPEVLQAAFAVNAPKVFTILYGIIKPLISLKTLEKIKIFGYDDNKWKKAILEEVPSDQLPRHWGGTKPGNDEFCSSLVCMGGPVPNKYLRNGGGSSALDENENDDLICVTVGAGQKWSTEYDVLYNNSTLRWIWKTDLYDIGFQLTYEDFENEIVPYKRVDSHKSKEEGSVLCERAGKYILTFDNTYSRLRAKTLRYFVTITSPEGILIEDEDNQTSL